MQGTTFDASTKREKTLIPENPLPNAPPRGALFSTGPPRYGTMPTFPAPAPQSARYYPTMPDLVTVNGAWSLYVMDTGGAGRGVIRAGRSSSTTSSAASRAREIDVPSGTSRRRGAAVSDRVRSVQRGSQHPRQSIGVFVELRFEHERPRDLQMLLESPTQQRVMHDGQCRRRDARSEGLSSSSPTSTTTTFPRCRTRRQSRTRVYRPAAPTTG